MTAQKTMVAGIAVAVVAVLMLTTVLAAQQANRTLTNTGSITTVNVGVYSDSGCTQVLSTVDWGALIPGSSTNKTIYIKNTGTTMVSLNMTVNAWNPANASSYMTLTWNREGTVLNVNNVISASLMLTVSSSVSGITNFGFNATITGTQV